MRHDCSEKSGKYIPKSETSLIKQHLQKAYDEKILKFVTAETQCLKKLLDKSDKIVSKIQKTYSDYPAEVKNYINPIDISDEDFANAWMEIPFDKKPIQEYLPLLETKHQERVRSKSELNIANALAEKGIPYKYECPLQLSSGVTVYPDFTVLDVKRRKVFYWEHRGMMDDKEYARSSVQRVKTLIKDGLYIGEELIITEETSTTPLGTNEIEAVIKKYFFQDKH